VIGVTGRMAVCVAVGEGGTPRCSARPPALWSCQIGFELACCPQGNTRVIEFRTAGLPELFCCDQHPAPRVDRENTAAGLDAPESLGTVTKAGEVSSNPAGVWSALDPASLLTVNVRAKLRAY
jgi:hypothetical protein